MKYFGFFLLILFASCQKRIEQKDSYIKVALKPSKIDSLNTNEEIENYLHNIDSNYRRFKLGKFNDLNRDHRNMYYKIADSLIKNLAKKLEVNQSFYKEDFDNNGFSDLLITGDHYYPEDYMATQDVKTLILMNYGNDSINIHLINKNRHPLPVPKITLYKNQPFLKLYEIESRSWENKKIKDSSTTTLTYKFDNFIEYNKQSANHSIESIEFSTSGCFGICPIYKLTINNNRTATFLAKGSNFKKDIRYVNIKNNTEMSGFFKGKIKNEDYNKLINTLNYIDFKNLKDEYYVSWTDDQTGELKITYDNGKVKYIEDYGMVGTYGLKAVYQQLADLRFNQDWQEVQEPKSKK